VARLEVLALTDEDRRKTNMYAQERQRREFAAEAGDPEQYLASLKMRMLVGLNDGLALKRLAQLTQKTNQFNLTSRRYTELDVQRFVDSDEWLVAHFSLSDIFGDAGIVGLALIQLEGERARLDTFLMSCRVIGRQAEAAFLDTLLRHLAATGTRHVLGEFLPTAKNELVEHFLAAQGFRRQEDGRWLRDLQESPPADAHSHPILVEIVPAS
jgi:FkbH-like protein